MFIVCASRHPPRPFGDLRRRGMHRRTTSCGCQQARPESLQNHGQEAFGGSLLSSQSAVWTPRELFGARWTLRGRARGAPEASRRRSGSARGGPGEVFGTLWGGPGNPWALLLGLFRWQKVGSEAETVKCAKMMTLLMNLLCF